MFLIKYYSANDNNNRETSNSVLEDAAEETLTRGQVISAAASIKIRGRKNQNGVSGAKVLLNWKKKSYLHSESSWTK